MRQFRHLAMFCVLVFGAIIFAGCSLNEPAPTLVPTKTPTNVPQATLNVSLADNGFSVIGSQWLGFSQITLGIEPSVPQPNAPPMLLSRVVASWQGSFDKIYAWENLTNWREGVAYELVALAGNQTQRVPFPLKPPATATPTETPAPPTETPTSEPMTETPTSTPLPPTETPTESARKPTSTPWPVAIAVAPQRGWVGTTITISGVNWPPRRALAIQIAPGNDEPDETIYARGNVNAQGRFTLSFAFPNASRLLGQNQARLIVRATDGSAEASANFALTRPAPTATPTASNNLWKGEYFNKRALTGAPTLTRYEETVDFRWGAGSPAANIPADNFAARWTRSVTFAQAGDYRFYAKTDDGVRVWLDQWLIIDDWTDGGRLRTGEFRGLGSGKHTVKIEYYEATGDASATVWWERTGPITEWKGEYFPNRSLEGAALITRNDSQIDFDWGLGAPAPEMPVDHFSARWTQTIAFTDGVYRFTAQMDDGMRVWVDNRAVINQWNENSIRTTTGEIGLANGQHTVKVEYVEFTNNAQAKLTWQRVGDRQIYNPRINVYELDLQRFVVNGSGWPAGERISLALGRVRPGGDDVPDISVYLGEIQAESDGSFIANFGKPRDVAANLYVIAVSRDYVVKTPYNF